MASEQLKSIRQRIAKLREFLETGDPVTSVSFPGFSASYDRAGAIKELRDLEKQEAFLSGRRSRINTIDMRNSF
jgi:hypothetical protein